MTKIQDLTEHEKETICLNAQRICLKYPNYYPIYCHSDHFTLSKNKYLVSGTMPFAQFIYVVRKKLKLEPHEAVFFLIGNELMPKTSDTIAFLFENYSNKELGCLYVQILKENTFGSS
jgi:hypothetical protein